MAQTLQSIKILTSLQGFFQEAHPHEEVPEEITVNPLLVNDQKKYFCPSGSDLKAEQIPSGTELFVVDTFDNACEWNHLKELLTSEAKNSITTLYLGHDGCITGDRCDIEVVLSGLPNLKEVHYCGYYAQYEDDLVEICEQFHIVCTPIH